MKLKRLKIQVLIERDNNIWRLEDGITYLVSGIYIVFNLHKDVEHRQQILGESRNLATWFWCMDLEQIPCEELPKDESKEIA